MYSEFRQACERLLRIPADPHAPPGDEASTRIYRAAKNYYQYAVIVWAITSAATILPALVATIVLAIMAAADRHVSGWWILIPSTLLIIFIISSLFHLAIIRLDYEKRWYIVTDRSLRVREGVIGVQEMTVTFANIQNISIDQGPIQRLLRIADLRVDTAGGGGSSQGQHYGQTLHTARFRGIDNATEVRELIQNRLRQYKDAGLGDHDDLHHQPGQSAGDMLDALRAVYDEAKGLNATLARSA